jgi:hypothetical protein
MRLGLFALLGLGVYLVGALVALLEQLCVTGISAGPGNLGW